MRTKVSPEVARYRLSERRARLAKFLEINAPSIIVENERRLISNAIYELETGFTKEETSKESVSSEG
jgi:DNA-directed RNA polymerase subunit K/omega